MSDCVRYLCWAVGGMFLAQKRVVYLFRGDISDMERATVQFNVRCVRDGSYFIRLQTKDLIIVFSPMEE